MFDMKALTPEQIAILRNYMDESLEIQKEILRLGEAFEFGARAVAKELGMGEEGEKILLVASRKAFEALVPVVINTNAKANQITDA